MPKPNPKRLRQKSFTFHLDPSIPEESTVIGLLDRLKKEHPLKNIVMTAVQYAVEENITLPSSEQQMMSRLLAEQQVQRQMIQNLMDTVSRLREGGFISEAASHTIGNEIKKLETTAKLISQNTFNFDEEE